MSTDREGRDPLHYAALRGEVDHALRELDSGANVDSQDRHGSTALHFAAQSSEFATARVLLARGADVNLANEFGNTPLWTAVYNSRGNGELITLLLDLGADPDHVNTAGRTPRQLADTLAHRDLARLFEDR